MSKEQKRMVAFFLCVAGVVGTLMALKEDSDSRNMPVAPETQIETVAAL